MITLYKPEFRDLWFRAALLSDPDTMAYNRAWGGVIAFPESARRAWYDHWLAGGGRLRFYRYLYDEDAGRWVGEVAYHHDAGLNAWLANVIVAAKERRRGCGRQGLALLCAAAKANGVDVLRDNIAPDNPGIRLFLEDGFVEEYRTDEFIMLKKELV